MGRIFGVVLTAVWLACMPAVANAGKAHCRDLVFSGSSGPLSNDKVTLRIADAVGGVMDTSCTITVNPSETGRHFASRLVAAWGDGSNGLSLPCPNENPPEPFPKQTCGNQPVGSRSCQHKFKFKPDKTTVDPDDGLVLVRVCCKDALDCKGAKATSVPVSVQSTKADPAANFAPTVPPPAGFDIVGVALDPIGMTQLPGGSQVSCRKDIAGAVSAFALSDLSDRVKGVPTLPDPSGLHTVAAKCEAAGSSAISLGYATCPAPCNGIQVGHCVAGLTGNPCAKDAECDLAGGDGRCDAPWPLVADCLLCLADSSVAGAFTQALGSGVPGGGSPCQDGVGKMLLTLAAGEIKTTLTCQKSVDGGKLSLPPNPPGQCAGGICVAPPLNQGKHCNIDADCNLPPVCKRADLGGKRAAVEGAVAKLGAFCSDPDFATFPSCATTLNGEMVCLVDIAQRLNRSIADVMFPEQRVSP